MDFNGEVFKGHAIAEVPIQPVGLLDQDVATHLVIAQKPHHLAELTTF